MKRKTTDVKKKSSVVKRKTGVKNALTGASGKTAAPGSFTASKKSEFLELYATGEYTVKAAAVKVGVSHVTIFYTKRNDPEFEAQFVKAQENLLDALEDRLMSFATGGNEKGNLTAIFGLLNAKRPLVWRRNTSVDVNAKVNHTFPSQFAQAMAQELGLGVTNSAATH